MQGHKGLVINNIETHGFVFARDFAQRMTT